MTPSIRRDVKRRLERIEIPFNRDGIDPYGVSRKNLSRFMQLLGFFYRHYFRGSANGLEHIPARGRAMIVSNQRFR